MHNTTTHIQSLSSRLSYGQASPTAQHQLSINLLIFPGNTIHETLPLVKCLYPASEPAQSDLAQSNRDKCVTGDLMDRWLQLWATQWGYSLSTHTGWNQNSDMWIAQTQLFSLLNQPGYCLYDALRAIDYQHVTAQGPGGNFVKDKILFSVFVAPVLNTGVGHWYYICLRPNQQTLEVGESTSSVRYGAAACIARFWDDLCTLAYGFNQNAQSWTVKHTRTGLQHGIWECGFYTLHGISNLGETLTAQLQVSDLDKVKMLLAADL
jgi:hypothetical protein